MSRAEAYFKDGQLIVRGPRVTDGSILEQLKLDDSESAVIVDPEIVKRAIENLSAMERTGQAPPSDKTEVS